MEITTFIIIFIVVVFLKTSTQKAGKNRKRNKRKNFTKKTSYTKHAMNNFKTYKKDTTNKHRTFRVSELSEHFKISPRELNKIFEKLKWVKREGKWLLVTDAGIDNGGVQKYNTRNKTKFVRWKPSIKSNTQLLALLELEKESKEKPLSKKEKKEKGDAYEAFIANHLREQGYTIAEHGKDNGVKDHGIDIIAKMNRNIYFIQCKNWSAQSSYKVRDKELKVSRQDARDYMMKHPLYVSGGYKMKLLYIVAEDVFHKSALYYAEEHKEIIECQVMPMRL
ncbi:MAG: restriction endonuclease [Campylobacterota bacterium]|nr:restriction endonuclease [Campylobacterota bacterium]